MKTQTLRFDGNFDIVIGSKKAEFLKKCSEIMTPVTCKDTYSGSIVVVVEGKAKDLKAKTTEIVSTGLSVPNFAPLTIGRFSSFMVWCHESF